VLSAAPWLKMSVFEFFKTLLYYSVCSTALFRIKSGRRQQSIPPLASSSSGTSFSFSYSFSFSLLSAFSFLFSFSKRREKREFSSREKENENE
jgi:hypothetical protein